MSIIHENSLKYPEIFNSDRNIMMAGGGTHAWNSSYEWSFDGTIYLSWFAERLRGAADYNIIEVTQSPVTIPMNSVAYVTLNNTTNGASLTPTVVGGASLPRGDNIVVVASHKDVGIAPNNPLMLKNGTSIAVGAEYSATAGTPVTGYTNTYSGTTWTIVHGLGTVAVQVTLQDNAVPPKQIFAEKIEFTDANTVTVTFGETTNGRAVVIKGNY